MMLRVWLAFCFVVALATSPLAVAKDCHEKPLIGIMLNDGGDKSYSIYPWYAMRKNYSDIVAKQGGIPVFIGHDMAVLYDYLDRLDGIVLTGGDLQSPPQAYDKGHVPLKPQYYPRQSIEYVLVQEAFKRDMPIFGICAGMQNMNVALGGTLANLKESGKTTFEHRVENREEIQHVVNVVPQSKLFCIVKKRQFGVNSNHREGINRLSDKLVISARAPDKVIEALEAPDKSFFIGVIWHPEFVLSEQDERLWKAFVKASEEYANKKAECS